MGIYGFSRLLARRANYFTKVKLASRNEDDELLQKNKEYRYVPEKMTWDPNCYECKVRYRDPKSKDLVMYLHAWRYKVMSFISTPMAPLCFALTEIGQF